MGKIEVRLNNESGTVWTFDNVTHGLEVIENILILNLENKKIYGFPIKNVLWYTYIEETENSDA